MLTFEQFRSKLADVVTVAINSGRRIVPLGPGPSRDNCCCPLGCHPDFDLNWSYPVSSVAARTWGVDLAVAGGLMMGFEGEPPRLDTHNEAYRLGRLYRARFGGKP